MSLGGGQAVLSFHSIQYWLNNCMNLQNVNINFLTLSFLIYETELKLPIHGSIENRQCNGSSYCDTS